MAFLHPDTGLLQQAAEHVHAAIRSSHSTPHDVPEPWSDAAFDALACEVFRAQYASIPVYRAWVDLTCSRTGVSPADISTASDVPTLPIGAYKRSIVAPDQTTPETAAATWYSSGTTGSERSQHVLPSIDLYDASVDATAARVLTLHEAPFHCIQVHPSGIDMPHGSLSHMFDRIRTRSCATADAPFATVTDDGVIHVAHEQLVRALGDAERRTAPVLVLATSFALVEVLDALRGAQRPITLPAGSIVVDTGGTKGRTRDVARSELEQMIAQWLGVPTARQCNEYGMSEVSSQAWSMGRGYWTPPWLRVQVVDPVTLEPVADGSTGLLVLHDLANVYSCAKIRTEDIGERIGDSFRVVGRAPGAVLRGCSLQLEDIAHQ